MSFDTATPFIAAYVILRKGNQVAFVLRGENTKWMSGYYGLPAGKVEKDESFTAAAIREAKEEAGITIDRENLLFTLTMHRKEPDMEWVDIFFEVDKWDGEPFNAEPHMHKELAWLESEELPENIVPNVKYALEQIDKGRVYCEFGWE